MRIGILGGTFDPVHIGHLIIAEEALSRLALDQVLFIPAGQPWLKADQALSTAEHRLKMVQLAIASNPRLGVSRIEVDRSGPTYTVDTLERLREDLGEDVQLYFILGLDALEQFPPLGTAGADNRALSVGHSQPAGLPELPNPGRAAGSLPEIGQKGQFRGRSDDGY